MKLHISGTSKYVLQSDIPELDELALDDTELELELDTDDVLELLLDIDEELLLKLDIELLDDEIDDELLLSDELLELDADDELLDDENFVGQSSAGTNELSQWNVQSSGTNPDPQSKAFVHVKSQRVPSNAAEQSKSHVNEQSLELCDVVHVNDAEHE